MAAWNEQKYYEDIKLDEEIPSVPIALTLQRMVMEAGANRDFSSIHHDQEVARATGAPGVYMNFFFIMGMIERLLREWIGLQGKIKKIGPFRMKIFNCVGDTVTYKAKVKEKKEEKSEGMVILDIWSETHRGRTVIGESTVILPRRQ